MKKILFSNLLFLLITNFIFSQNQLVHREDISPTGTPKCGFNSIHKELENSDPSYKLKTDEFNNYLRNGNYQVKAGTIYQIPVVVHVMETGNSLTDITDDQIKEAIRGLNEQLRKEVGTPGDGNGVDVEIEYVLAVRDPSGNCTNGISRFDMTGDATYMASGVRRSSGSGITDASLKALVSWNKTKYYNIWLISEIDDNNAGSGIQGYAFFASSHGTASDGAVIISNNFENAYSSTAIHEIGHSLNLFHTFEGDLDDGSTCPVGNGCGSDVGDCCADTPPHMQSNSDCVVGTNACYGGSSTNLFIHNYMEYSNDACQNELTADQKTRMQAAVTVTRASYLASNGNDALIPVAAPVTDFKTTASIICGVGQTIQFYDLSTCTPNSYLPSSAWTGITFNWTFTNGTDTYTSTAQNPQINFIDAGNFDVTLIVNNGVGSQTLTKNNYVIVSSAPVAACIPNSNNECNCNQTVNNVTFNTINNSTSTLDNLEYTDFSCSNNTIVEDGQTYVLSVSIKAGGSGSEVFEAYIDYNNDGDFADAGEQVLTGSTASNTTNIVTGNVTIPGTAVQNTLLRMRIIGEAGSILATERTCSANMFIADVEDYGILITPACATPATPTITPSATSFCTGGNVTLTSSSAVDNVWSTGETTQAITVTTGGTYTVYVSTGGCDSATDSEVITENANPATPTITPSGATTFCAGGSVDLTSSSAVDNTWSTGETTQIITVSATGNYNVTVTTSGCSSISLDEVVTENTPIVIAQGTTSNPTSCAGTDGSIEITGAGTGDLSYTGTASGNNVGVTLPFTTSGLAAGTYDFTFNDGCNSNTVSVTISDPVGIVIAQGATSNPTSCGGADGSIEITGLGTGDLSYTGTASGNNTGVTLPFTTPGLAAGTYDFTFNDGCNSNTVSVSISDPGAPANPTITPSGATTFCAGGSVTLTSSSAVDNVWSTGETTQSITVTTSNTYSVFVSTAGCNSGTTNEVVTVNPLPPTPTITPSGATTFCNGGSVDLTSSSAVDNTWSSGETTQTITVTVGGNYNVMVTTAGCSSTSLDEVVTVTPGAVIAQGATSNPTACLAMDGSIEITGAGTGDLSYTGTASGNNVGITLPFTTSGLGAGTYDFTFNDGCNSNTVSVTISDPAGIVIAQGATSNPTACLAMDGSIEITGVGTGDLSYTGTASGNNVGITLPFTTSSLGAGTYDFTFNDGCNSNTVSVTISDPSGIVIAQGTTSNPTACLAMDGSIEITGVGTGDLSYTGTASGNNVGITLPFTTSGLGAGTYDFIFNDGCNSNTVNVTISDPSGIVIAQGTTSNPTACFATDGSIEITGVGTGDLSYTGTASGNNVGITLPFTTSSLGAGTYDFTFNDGCNSNTVSVTISDPAGIVIAQGATSNPTVCLAADGSIEITGVGTGDLSYTGTASGTDFGVTLPFTTSTFTAGTYDFTFNDGCLSNTVSVTLTDPNPVIAQGTTSNPTACLATDGSIEITGTGTGDLSYTGTASGTDFGITLPFTTSTFTSGTYDFTFNNGCVSNTVSVTLSDPNPVIAQGTTSNPTVCFGADGSIEITGTGTGDLSYTGTAVGTDFGVTLPFTTSTFTAGTYDFTFNDGCVSNTVSVTLSDPAGSVIAQGATSNPTACLAADGSIEITGAGTGDLSYTGTASGTDFGVTLPFTTSTFIAGTYDFTFNDGCLSNTVSVTLTDPNPVIAQGTTSNPTACLAADGSIEITGVGTGDLSYTGTATGTDFGITLPFTTSTFTSGTYDFTFNNGCNSNTVSVTLTDPNSVIAVGTTSNPTVCLAADGSIEITGVGTGDLSYTGTSSGTDFGVTLPFTTSTFTAGTYDFTFTNTCVSNTVSVTLTDPNPVIALGTTSNPTVCLASDGSIEITGAGTGDLSYTGTSSGTDFGVNLPFTSNIFTAGTYDFTFNNGCMSNTVSVTLTDPNPVIALGTTSNPTACLATDGSIEITGLGTGDLSYTGTASGTDFGITLPFTTSTFASGTYDFTFNNGCVSNTVSVTLTAPNPVIALGTTSNPTTCLAADGSIEITGVGTGDLSYTGTATGTDFGVTLPFTTSTFTAGTYDFTFNNGCVSNTVSVTLTDPAAPATPIISASGPTDFCLGDNVVLTSSSAIDNVWSTGETTQSITVLSSGTYNVSVVNGMCSSISTDVIVNVNSTPTPTPTISAGGPTTFCAGGNVVLTSSSVSNNTWSTSQTTQSITVSSSGTFDVTVNIGGCVATSAPITITENPIPSTPVISANGPTTLCSGTTLVLTSSAPSNNTWSTGSTSQTINVTTSGSYSVTVDQLGCTASSAPINVVVNQTPPVPLITADGSYTFCEGGSVNLTTTASSNFTWSTGQTLQTINVNNTQTISVSVTINGCTSTSANVNVTENANPVVTLAPFNDVCNTSGIFALTNGIPSGGNYMVNGVSTTTFNPATAFIGANTIDYTLVDGNGCTGSTTGFINVLNCVDVEEISTFTLTLFPNPTEGVVHLKGENLDLISSIELHDELGRLIAVYSELTETIDLSEYANGIYTLLVKGDNIEQIHKVQLVK